MVVTFCSYPLVTQMMMIKMMRMSHEYSDGNEYDDTLNAKQNFTVRFHLAFPLFLETRDFRESE